MDNVADTPTSEADGLTAHTPITGSKRTIGRLMTFLHAHPVMTVFIAALVVRVTVAIILDVLFDGSISLDDSTYSQMASDWATGNTASWNSYIRGLWLDTATFLLPLSTLYGIFGSDHLAGQLFVALVGAGAAGVTAALALRVLGSRAALIAGSIVAFLPSQILWSSVTMKDAAVWLLVALMGLLVALCLQQGGRPLLLTLIAIGVTLTLLAFLRLHTLVIASWALMISVWFGIAAGRIVRISTAFALAIFVPMLVGIGPAGISLIVDSDYSLQERRELNAVGANSAVVEPLPEPGTVDLSAVEQRILTLLGQEPPEPEAVEEAAADVGLPAEEVARIQKEVDEKLKAEAAKPRPLDPGPASSLAPNLAHLPRGLSVMLLEPFPLPWEGSFGLRMARTETLIWYPVLVVALLGVTAAFKRYRFMIFPCLAGAATVVVYALTDGNLGTAYRHRGEFVWVIALLATFGMQRLTSKTDP